MGAEPITISPGLKAEARQAAWTIYVMRKVAAGHNSAYARYKEDLAVIEALAEKQVAS